MRIDWHRQHRRSSLAVCFFLVMFCVSGILLNHRDCLREYELSRSLLPPFYRYNSWNGGLLRGTVMLPGAPGQVAVYGAAGIFLTDTAATEFRDYTAGLPAPAHYRNIRAMAVASDSCIYALSTTGLYRSAAPGTPWREVALPAPAGEAFSDLLVHGDSIIVLGRSQAYVAAAPDAPFGAVRIAAPADGVPGETLFRRVWDLHSGRMLGTAGILVADLIALVIIFLCLTGLVIWLVPAVVRRRKRRGQHPRRLPGRILRFSLRTHRAAGLWSLVFVAAICLTGWCLRPPVLLALVSAETAARPTANPWADMLRMLRYDHATRQWILSTSRGFYRLDSLRGCPGRIEVQPPVSVMGLNVLHQVSDSGQWLAGSFSGAYLWDLRAGTVTDYITGEPADLKPGPPFGKTAVAGYSPHLRGGDILVTYDGGNDRIPMPGELATLPMPLWNVALEIHTGRIYVGNSATYFFVFIIGLLVFWCLLSGYMVSRRR